MADEPKPDPKPDDWKPPTREEWEATQRSLQNKTEEADRHAKKAAKVEADRRAAEEKALAEQGQYKTLAEQREAELKAEREKLSAYEAREAEAVKRAEAKLAEAVKAWAPEEKALYLKPSMSVDERLEIAEARNAERKGKGGTPRAPGYAPGADGTPHGGYADAMEWATKDPKGFLEAQKKRQQKTA